MDDLIRKRRKPRNRKACYPCQRRKVKCDGDLPCEACVQRGHPDLCLYNMSDKSTVQDESESRLTNQPNGEELKSAACSLGYVVLAKEQWDAIVHELQYLRMVNSLATLPDCAFTNAAWSTTSYGQGTNKPSHSDPALHVSNVNRETAIMLTPADEMLADASAPTQLEGFLSEPHYATLGVCSDHIASLSERHCEEELGTIGTIALDSSSDQVSSGLHFPYIRDVNRAILEDEYLSYRDRIYAGN